MAKEEIAYSVSVDTGNGAKSLSALKKEFKETQNQITGLQRGTKEYIATLEKLGGIKDQIGDLRGEISAFSSDAIKTETVGNTVYGLANSFAAAQGAMALMGVEGEDLQKTLVKVQAASAFAQGLKGVSQLKDQFNILFAVIKANPLGAFLAAISAIAVAAVAFYQSMDKSSESTKRLNKELEIQKEANEALSRSIKREIDLMTAQGKSQEEIIIKKRELINAQIAELEISIKLHQSKVRDILDNDGIYEGILRIQEATLRKLGLEEQANAVAKAIQAEKQDRMKEDLEAIKKEKEDLLDLRNTIEILSQEEINIEKNKTKEYQNELKKRAEAQRKHLEDIEKIWQESFYNSREARAVAQDEADKQRREKEVEDLLVAYKEDLNMFSEHELNKSTVAVEQNKFRAALEDERTGAALDIARESAASQQALSDLVFSIKMRNLEKGSRAELELAKKQFKINKALAIQSAIISTIQGVVNALSAQSVIPEPFGTILKIATAVGVGIAGAANVAKIASQQFNPSASGGGGGGAAIPSPAPPSIAPPTQGGTQLNPDGTIKPQTKSEPVVKAIVVETDITKTQKNVGVIESNSRL